MIAALVGAALTVVVMPDPGTSAAGASVSAGAQQARAAADGRASLDLTPGTYDVVVEKPGFVSAHAHTIVDAHGSRVRIALHAVPAAALRTIGAVAAAERGAFNGAPAAVTVVPREAYRDMSQPGLDGVLTQKPSILIDRAGRGLSDLDAPPVPLVRGGTPLETQTLLEGVPIALATTRTVPLSAIPSFVIQELEVDPGTAAPLPAIDGAVNGTLNLRFAEPIAAWRALPEHGVDGRGGSFSDVTGGGASADRRIAFAFAATANGVRGDVAATDTVQHATLLKTRAALSSASGLTLTRYDENDADRAGGNRFDFTSGEYRLSGAQSTVLARAWHVDSLRDGIPAGDPLARTTNDGLTGGSLEVDRSAGTSVFSAGATETDDAGTATGAIVVPTGSHERILTSFLRAVVAPSAHWQAQLTGYLVGIDANAGAQRFSAHGLHGRAGVSYRVSDRLALRASSGSGFTPPSLVALAFARGGVGVETATTNGLGVEARVFDAHTTLSADVFSQTGGNRFVEAVTYPYWRNSGAFARRGAEFSLARFVPAGFGYLLQAWTASDTPSLDTTFSDAAAAHTQGYAELSYHWRSGSRFSFGTTSYGADPALGQSGALLLNSNLEIQLGQRGKLQFDLENVSDARLRQRTDATPSLVLRNAFAPAPRTLRVVVRRSFGRTGTDG